jgi:hypothetical protein
MQLAPLKLTSKWTIFFAIISLHLVLLLIPSSSLALRGFLASNLVFVAVLFLTIFVHELGHALG